MQPVVVDAEVVCHLMHDGDPDLVDQLLLRLAHVEQRVAEDEDAVGELKAVGAVSLGHRHPVVQAEQVGLVVGRFVLDEYDDVAHQLGELVRDVVEGLVDQRLEALPADVDGHPPIVLDDWSDGGSPVEPVDPGSNANTPDRDGPGCSPWRPRRDSNPRPPP